MFCTFFFLSVPVKKNLVKKIGEEKNKTYTKETNTKKIFLPAILSWRIESVRP